MILDNSTNKEYGVDIRVVGVGGGARTPRSVREPLTRHITR